MCEIQSIEAEIDKSSRGRRGASERKDSEDAAAACSASTVDKPDRLRGFLNAESALSLCTFLHIHHRLVRSLSLCVLALREPVGFFLILISFLGITLNCFHLNTE